MLNKDQELIFDDSDSKFFSDEGGNNGSSDETSGSGIRQSKGKGKRKNHFRGGQIYYTPPE